MQRRRSSQQATVNPHTTHRVIAHDGLVLNAQEWGPAHSKRTCVLIHGLAEGSFVWNEFAGRMERDCRIIALDLRGHGASAWDPQKRYGIDAYVADVERVLIELAIDRPVLVGHSLGGEIVARIMESHRALAGVVLVDTGPTINAEVGTVLRDRLIEGYRSYSSIQEYSNWLADTRPLAPPHAIDGLARHSLIQDPIRQFRLRFDVAVTDILARERDSAWWWAALAGLQAPLKIVRGKASAIVNKKLALKMAAVSRSAQIGEVENAGHAVMTDNPNGFLFCVRTFCLQCG